MFLEYVFKCDYFNSIFIKCSLIIFYFSVRWFFCYGFFNIFELNDFYYVFILCINFLDIFFV